MDTNSIKQCIPQLVSVIIPTYKRCDMLGRAIDSVLDQTYKLIEVIIVDDNNCEDIFRKKTNEFMKKYCSNDKVIYIKHKRNKNGAAARNTGIKYSKGEYIAFLDDDDEFLPEKIEKQINRIKSFDGKYGAVYCGCQIITNNHCIKKVLNLNEGNLKKELLLEQNYVYGGTTLLFRRDVLIELNGFDETFIRHQDWELLIRFFRKYKILFVNEILVNIYVDSNINKINGEKFKKIKNKFLLKFKEDIKEFDYETQLQIYKVHYLEVLDSYLYNRDYKVALKYFRTINNTYKFTNNDRITILINFLKSLLNTKVKQVIRNIIYKKI